MRYRWIDPHGSSFSASHEGQLEDHVPKGGRVLALGCGNSALSEVVSAPEHGAEADRAAPRGGSRRDGSQAGFCAQEMFLRGWPSITSVDFSELSVSQARARAAARGLGDKLDYLVPPRARSGQPGHS